MRLIFQVVLLVAAGPAWAQKIVSSPAQEVRRAYLRDCVNRSLKDGDADYAYRFCTCSFNVLANSMTLNEYIEMETAMRQRDLNLDSLPQLARIKGKLEACKQSK